MKQVFFTPALLLALFLAAESSKVEKRGEPLRRPDAAVAGVSRPSQLAARIQKPRFLTAALKARASAARPTIRTTSAGVRKASTPASSKAQASATKQTSAGVAAAFKQAQSSAARPPTKKSSAGVGRPRTLAPASKAFKAWASTARPATKTLSEAVHRPNTVAADFRAWRDRAKIPPSLRRPRISTLPAALKDRASAAGPRAAATTSQAAFKATKASATLKKIFPAGCRPGCSVAFVGGRLETWERYREGGGSVYLGGEAYWAAGLAHMLEKSGHKVTFYKPQPPRYEIPAEAKQACRIIVDAFPYWAWQGTKMLNYFGRADFRQGGREALSSVDARIKLFFDDLRDNEPGVLSRLRMLDWWGGKHGPYRKNMLVPFRSFDGNAVPFPVHAELMQSQISVPVERGRKVFLFGKALKGDFCRSHIKPLVDAKFEVHTTSIKCKDMPQVKSHGMLAPAEFGKLLGTMAVVIGLDDPPDSPTPFEAMASGAPFLNPFKDRRDVKRTSQVKYLTQIGEPNVYSYDLHNASSMVETAIRAVEHRITHYVPEAHQVTQVKAAMCKYIFN